MKISRSISLLFGVTLLCTFIVVAYGEEIKTISTIKSATIFTDQALITRTASVRVSTGVNTIIFIHLPETMIDQSMRVSGVADAEALISDIKIERLYLDTIPASRTAELFQRLNALRNEKNTLEKNYLAYKSQVDAVEALKDNFTKSLANSGQKPSIDEWDKMLQYVERKKSDFSAKMEQLRIEIDAKMAKIKAVEDEIRASGGLSKKGEKQVVVTLNAKKGSTLSLEVSYLIPDASWWPAYEVRAASSERTLQILYSGFVRQSSGEDWNTIDVVLSTAQPAMSERIPTLSGWIVDTKPVPGVVRPRLRKAPPRPLPAPEMTLDGNTLSGHVLDMETNEPLAGANILIEGANLGGATNVNGEYIIYNIPEGKYRVRASMVGYQMVEQANISISKSNGAMQTFYLQQTNISAQEVVVTATRPQMMQSMTNTVRNIAPQFSLPASQVTSTSFTIQSKQSIPSDNQKHKVGIAIDDLPIDLSYDAVPKEIEAAYLKGKGKNVRDYPLLAGDANVFLDNSFIASVPMKTIMPNDSFEVSLGVDEAIRVERRMISRVAESVGTFSKNTRINYHFENKVENHKKNPVHLTLVDQVPVSRDAKILVEVIDPKPEKLMPDANGIFKWVLDLPAGGAQVVKLEFTVEFPADVYPYGLEQ